MLAIEKKYYPILNSMISFFSGYVFSLTHVTSDCTVPVPVGVLISHSAVVAKCLLRVMGTEEKQYVQNIPSFGLMQRGRGLTFSIFYPIACENN